ncbi:MAG: signal peptidase I [Bacilli bacterium]|nr:signal peptidase I [Bacilli bacterium]
MSKDNNKDTTKEYFIYVCIILLIVFIRSFIVTPVRVNGDSMYPTLKDGEIMLLNKINYRFNDIKRFDIVVVNTKDEKIIKRVIGLPGETLEIKDNVLYINGKEVKEDFLKEETRDFDMEAYGMGKRIPDDSYFVMGDNRDNSMDSRIIGPVKKSQITGRTRLVVFPFKAKGYRN